jgi:hypothetical protein
LQNRNKKIPFLVAKERAMIPLVKYPRFANAITTQDTKKNIEIPLY